jgi:hypothetical protein
VTSGHKSRRRARKPLPFAYFATPSSVDNPPSELRSKAIFRLSWLLLLGSFGVVATVLWLSLQYLVNPDVAFWLDHELFGAARSRHTEVSTPQTLDEVQAALGKTGLTAGQPIVLKSDFALQSSEVKTASDIAMPILEKAKAIEGCSDPCQNIHQIRIYRSLQLPWLIRLFLSKPYFRLTDVISVQGPTGADLLALDQNPLVSAGSDQPLPLTQSDVYNPAPAPGLWLRLTGLQSQGSSVSTYGQIFYFDPRRERLNLMTNWVSPPGEVPQWQQVTGDNVPELVVNQTVGLEPQYAIYRLKMADGVASQLRPIVLTEPALESRAYLDGLTLAKSGLWTPALELFQRVKQDSGKRWNQDAQAQFDYIQLHSRVTQAQANQPSASTVQRILGYLVNGSWTPALDVLQSDRSARGEVREMLLSDTGRLGNRIDTALKVMPSDPSVIAWGALLRMIRGSDAQALAWTQKQASGKAATVALVKKLFKLVNQPDTVAVPKGVALLPKVSGPNRSATPTSKGSASPVLPTPVLVTPKEPESLVPPPTPALPTPVSVSPVPTPAPSSTPVPVVPSP